MKALVTGGAGFLGSHLCDRLLSEGFDVIAVDNLVTGDLRNIEHLRDNPRFDFIKHDITQPIPVDIKLDYVYNFASPASPVDYLELPVETLLVGSNGTFNALELARRNNAIFTQASTSEVYGDPAINPQPEEYNGNVSPNGLRSCYDESKRYAEALVFAFHRKYGLDTKVVRIFNTYGPRMRLNDGRVVPTFVKQALNGEPLSIYGSGKQTRSFCYVSDLIDGIYKLSRSNEAGPINIGNPGERTMLEFAEYVMKAVGCENGVVYLPLPTSDDPKLRCPDITKARQLLGWEPKVDLTEGMTATINYFRKQIEGSNERELYSIAGAKSGGY